MHNRNPGSYIGYNFPPANTSALYSSTDNLRLDNKAVSRVRINEDQVEIKQYVSMGDSMKMDYILGKLSNPYPEPNRWTEILILIIENSFVRI
jgi:hypothetical protein